MKKGEINLKQRKDLTGKRFGKLIAISFTGKLDSKRCCIWKCQCDCGNICEASTPNLNGGHKKSCRMFTGRKDAYIR